MGEHSPSYTCRADRFFGAFSGQGNRPLAWASTPWAHSIYRTDRLSTIGCCVAPIDGRKNPGPTDKCEFWDSSSKCEIAGADMVLPGLKRIRRLRAQSRNLRWDGLSAVFAGRRHHEIPTLFPPLLCNRFRHLVHGDRISPGTGRWLVLLCVAPADVFGCIPIPAASRRVAHPRTCFL